MVNKLSCPKHGHPAEVSPRLKAWIDFYIVVAPYSTSPTTLDHQLISKLCTDYELNFSDAFEMLTIIQEAVATNENKRDKTGDTSHGDA